MTFGKILSFGKGRPDQATREQVARLYEYQGRLFVCSVRFVAEVGAPTILPADVDEFLLGETVLRHLAEFDPSAFDIKSDKASDWPAYLASAAKSIRSFESQLWHCDLRLAGWMFEVRARPQKTLKENLSARCVANKGDPAKVGLAVINALKGAKAMRDGGAI